MKFLILGLIIGGLAYSPVYLTENYVEPQLDQIRYQYAHAEEIADEAAGIKANLRR